MHSSETLGDWKRVSVYYNNIGVIYHLNGKYKDALTYYRNSIKIEKSVDSKKCDTPVKAQYELGRRIGVTGTPALILESGELLPGYVPPKRLKKILDEKA